MKNIILAASMAILSALISVQAQAAEVASGSLEGAFSSWGKSSLQGDWKIVEEGGAHYIELEDNFRAKKGPDVKIFLSPTPSTQVTGDNAVTGSVFVELISDFERQRPDCNPGRYRCQPVPVAGLSLRGLLQALGQLAAALGPSFRLAREVGGPHPIIKETKP